MKTEYIRLSNNDTLTMIGTLSTMINAGIPILETVGSLLEDAKGNTKKILMSIEEDLIQGKPLHVCFSKFPLVLDKVSVNIIKASEEAGTLNIVLKDLRDQIQKDMEFTDGIKSALMYPFIVLLVFLAVLLIILVVVIPKISTVFLQLRVDLPLTTRVLFFASNAILHNTIPLLIALFGMGFGIYFLFRFQKRFMLRFLYTLPFISTIIKGVDLTRFFRSMFLLLSSGVIITSALQLAKDVVIRQDIAKSIEHAQESVLTGKRLSETLKERKDIFSGTMIKIIEAGERTGTLDKSMGDISSYMDYQVARMLKTSTTLLEPLMLIFMSVLVGGMMISIISPIYGLISNIGGK